VQPACPELLRQEKEEGMNGSIEAGAMPSPDGIDPIPSHPLRLTAARRWISLAELVVGAAIVIGHNVYHVIPNEVPILFVIGLISLRVRDGDWWVIGLHWPISWRRTVLFALAAAAVRVLLGQFVTDPITAHFWPPAVGPSGFNEITGHAAVAMRWLLIIWTFARFRRRDQLPGLPGEARGGRGWALQSCLLDRRFACVGSLRIRTLLQRPLGSGGLRHGWPDSRSRLPVVRAQPVGVHSGARIH
jgi:hypothetical protein